MSDFTPGPWTVKSAIESQFIEDKAKCGGLNAILIVAEDDCVHHPIADASCNHSCRSVYEQEANAILMAAAPDLLGAMPTVNHPGGALIKVVAHYADGSTQTISGDVIEAAVAKATGEPS